MKIADADLILSRGISRRQATKLRSGGDALSILEPVDLHGLRRTPQALAHFEGESLALPPELLDFVSTRNCHTRTECDHIEDTLDRHYRLRDSGYGAAWDGRHRCARLVRL